MDDPDPRDLIGEAYRMSDLAPAECRTIFLDWAIGLPPGTDTIRLVRRLLARHEGASAHPMTSVLRDALGTAPATARRGGRAGRVRP